AMVADGALDGVDSAFGQHVSSNYPVGSLSYTDAYAYANGDSVNITTQGQCGHGAEPRGAIAPAVAAASPAPQLQSRVTRTADPLKSAVVTVGTFNSGSVFNVIPDTAEIRGTVRTFEREVKEQVRNRIENIARGIESSFGVQCTVESSDGYPALLNDNAQIGHVLRAVRDSAY